MAGAELLVRGRIATLAGDDGLGWVEAIAVAGGRVIAAGPAADVERLATAGTRRLALGPRDVGLPGLSDAHVHLLEASLGAERVDLAGAATLEAGLARLGRAHARQPDPDAWLEGGGWDPGSWGRWPTADDLEAAAPGRLVALWAHDRHALLASRRALREAGIEEATPDPAGGSIRRDRGRPTGVLHEHATRLVTARIPAPDAGRLERAIEGWCRERLADGVVAVHDMATLAPDAGLGGAFAAAARLDAAGRLPIRVHAGIREESLPEALARGLRTGDPLVEDSTDGRGGRARVGWWKRYADGSLGSRTAYLRTPYEPGAAREPGWRGMRLLDPAELGRAAARAAERGIATAVHAIGDAALDVALDALEAAATVGPARPAAQPRIEHAQLVADDHLPRLRAAPIALSMQPFHAAADGPAIGPAWGARARGLGYRWRSIVAAGIRLAFGTDAPVESASPWAGLGAAIDRGPAVLGEAAAWLDPTEALPLASALRGACVAPALVAGEHDRGRLAAGHRADLVVVELPAGGRLEDPAVLAALRPRLVLLDGAIVVET